MSRTLSFLSFSRYAFLSTMFVTKLFLSYADMLTNYLRQFQIILVVVQKFGQMLAPAVMYSALQDTIVQQLQIELLAAVGIDLFPKTYFNCLSL